VIPIPFTLTAQDALIVVDVQNDFTPGGALAVPAGDKIIPVINRFLPCFQHRVFTRDWHPPNHVSFSAKPEYRDLSWPPHCVQNTRGAEFHPDLQVAPDDKIVSKGDRPDIEALSGFQGTDLAAWLSGQGVKRVFVSGLATEFCVKNTALDAIRAGFETILVLDAARGIEKPKGSSQAAVQAMVQAGVKIATSRDLNCP
jgi:nicotinamidase/pyrazinamidase